MSAVKEPNYFADEIREGQFPKALMGRRKRLLKDSPEIAAFGGTVSRWDEYLDLFKTAGAERAVGEASVCYLWSESAARNISAKVPQAKIILMLRDPAERAYSQYAQGLGNGMISWSFAEHIQRSLKNRSREFSPLYPFLEFGLYAEQLIRYRERFGDRIWVGLHEEFQAAPGETVRRIFEFLGVAGLFRPEMGRKYMEAREPRFALAGWLRRTGWWERVASVTPAPLRHVTREFLTGSRIGQQMAPANRQVLVDYYRQDIAKLGSLLNRDLNAWTRPWQPH